MIKWKILITPQGPYHWVISIFHGTTGGVGPLDFRGCRSKNTVVSNLEVATIVSWALTMSILGESWTPHDWVNLKLGDEKNRDHFSIFPEKILKNGFLAFFGGFEDAFE